MKICMISDTHNKHWELEDKLKDIVADVIIHCGDVSSRGTIPEINNFVEWFKDLSQFKHKIFVAGNHDWLFETNNLFARELVSKGITYLQDEEVIIDDIKFYGSPMNLPFYDWAFNRPEDVLIKHWADIPDDTDVLITHQPPHSIFDWSVYDLIETGSVSLYQESLNRIKPNIHCFGHIHSGHGVKIIDKTTFVNASNLNERYITQYDPIVIEI